MLYSILILLPLMPYYIHGMMSFILIFSLNDDRFKGPAAGSETSAVAYESCYVPRYYVKKISENWLCIKKKPCTFPGRA